MGLDYSRPKLNWIFRVLNTAVEGDVEKWEVLGWIKNEPTFKEVKFVDSTRLLLRRLDEHEGRTLSKKQLQALFTGWFEEDVDSVTASLRQSGRAAVRGEPSVPAADTDRFRQYRLLHQLWNILDTKKAGLITSDVIATSVLKDMEKWGRPGFILKSRLDKTRARRIDFAQFSEFFKQWPLDDLETLLADLGACPPPRARSRAAKSRTLGESTNPVVVPPQKAWEEFLNHTQKSTQRKVNEANQKTKEAWALIQERKKQRQTQMLSLRTLQRADRQRAEDQKKQEKTLMRSLAVEKQREVSKRTEKKHRLQTLTKDARDRHRDEQCTDLMRSTYQQALRLVLLGPINQQEELMLDRLRETHNISEATHAELYEQTLQEINNNR